MTIAAKTCLSLAAFLAFTACLPKKPAGSTVRGIGANSDVRNRFVGIISPGQGSGKLKGPELDLKTMADLFTSPDLGFEVTMLADPEAQPAVDFIAEQASEAVLAEEGTLLIYYSGHGSQDGRLGIGREGLQFSRVVEALRAVRKKPFRRLVLLVDACFSGQLTRGETPVSQMSGVSSRDGSKVVLPMDIDASEEELFRNNFLAPLSALTHEASELAPEAGAPARLEDDGFDLAAPTASLPKPWRELLVVVSSSKAQVSADDPQGGRFTVAFSKAIAQARREKPTATIREVLEKVFEWVEHANRRSSPPPRQQQPAEVNSESAAPEPAGQRPDVIWAPDEILGEEFFGTGFHNEFNRDLAGLKLGIDFVPTTFIDFPMDKVTLRQRFLKVTQVAPGGIGAAIGLCVGDDIHKVGSYPVQTDGEYLRALKSTLFAGSGGAYLTVYRAGDSGPRYLRWDFTNPRRLLERPAPCR